jgi:hypothetical protein
VEESRGRGLEAAGGWDGADRRWVEITGCEMDTCCMDTGALSRRRSIQTGQAKIRCAMVGDERSAQTRYKSDGGWFRRRWLSLLFGVPPVQRGDFGRLWYQDNILRISKTSILEFPRPFCGFRTHI